jgi:tetratricopeptide (TPR) repeat protein
MNILLAILSILIVASACNNKADTEKVTIPVETAEQQLKNAIKAYPDSLQLRDKLIILYGDRGEYDAALVIINEVLAKDSTLAYFWDEKAKLHGFNDDNMNAIKAEERAVELDPQPEYLQTLGYLYADTKNEKAIDIADALIFADKAHSQKEALFIKGVYYSKAGNSQKAIGFFDDALALSYTFMNAYREKAIVQYNMGKYQDAIKTLEKGTTLQNNFDEGYYWMGRCYEKLGKTGEAVENYKMALLYDENYVEAADALGKLGVK